MIVAFEGPSETRVYRGNGTTSVLNHGQLYSSTGFKIAALAAGDFFSGGGMEIVTAFTASTEDRVYVGNGTTGLTNIKWIFQSNTVRITALTAGTFHSDADADWDLLTALEDSLGVTRVYMGDGTSYRQSLNSAGGVKNLGLPYAGSAYWNVDVMAAANLREGGGMESVTAFYGSTRLQLWLGAGASNLYTYYKFYNW